MQSTGVCPAQPFCAVGSNTERDAHFLLQNFVMIGANQVLGGGALHVSKNGSAGQPFPLYPLRSQGQNPALTPEYVNAQSLTAPLRTLQTLERHRRHEITNSLIIRVKELRRRPIEQQLPVLDEQNFVRHLLRKGHVVGHNDHRLLLLGNLQ